MKCKQCGTDIYKQDFEINYLLETDDGCYLDIIAECGGCGHKLNGFANIGDFNDINPLLAGEKDGK